MTRRGARNRPIEVYWEDGVSRLLNLLITLADSPRPRSTSWITGKVDGYGGSPDTVRKQFERDRSVITELGVRLIETTAVDDDGHTEKYFAIDEAASFRTPADFTAGQWNAVTAAGSWAMEPDLARVAQAAVTKLVPDSPVTTTDSAVPVIGAVPDATDLTDSDVRMINQALDHGLQLQFNYWPRLTAEPQRRTLEPWGVAAVDGRLFLTGFDLDREDQRTFLLSRIADLELPGLPCTRKVPSRPVRELVASGLEATATLVTAEILFRTDGALELRDKATGPVRPHPEGEIRTVGPVDRDWLVRTASAWAPDAVVLGPPDLVAEIISRLDTLLAHIDTTLGDSQ